MKKLSFVQFRAFAFASMLVMFGGCQAVTTQDDATTDDTNTTTTIKADTNTTVTATTTNRGNGGNGNNGGDATTMKPKPKTPTKKPAQNGLRYLKLSENIYINDNKDVVLYVDADLNKSEKLIYNTAKVQEITKNLYKYFKDDYDYIFLLTNNKKRPQSVTYAGVFSKVKNDVEGIGVSQYDHTANYGSGGKLMGIMHFAYRGAILGGPTLHEMCHYWANKFRFDSDDANGYLFGTGSHWGELSFYGGKGQLGGSDANTQQSYNYYYDGKRNKRWQLYSAATYGWNANGGNSIPYNDVELYLMGMIPKNDVKDIVVPFPYGLSIPPTVKDDQDFKDIVASESHRRYFMAVETKRKKWGDILSEHNIVDRNPDSTTSQKSFRILTVLLDTQMPKTFEADIISSQIESLAFAGDDGDDNNYNFWEATRHVGTLNVDNIDTTLKTSAQEVVMPDDFESQTITYKGIEYKTIRSKYTHRVWLDRNIGASKVCESYKDTKCYGSYVQWGRGLDGHEFSNSSYTKTKYTSLDNTANKFVLTKDTNSGDWVAGGVDDDGSIRQQRWMATDGSGVCPRGFRVPTKNEFEEETIKNEYRDPFKNRDDAYNSFLKFASAGYKNDQSNNGAFAYLGKHGMYWTSSISGNRATYVHFSTDSIMMYSTSHFAMGANVRCIKD